MRSRWSSRRACDRVRVDLALISPDGILGNLHHRAASRVCFGIDRGCCRSPYHQPQRALPLDNPADPQLQTIHQIDGGIPHVRRFPLHVAQLRPGHDNSVARHDFVRGTTTPSWGATPTRHGLGGFASLLVRALYADSPRTRGFVSHVVWVLYTNSSRTRGLRLPRCPSALRRLAADSGGLAYLVVRVTFADSPRTRGLRLLCRPGALH
uniref:Uncharacterized protein n=1 Tax=Oryza glumipatula TaxID=40148 RepID=A0A0E0AFM9_9ORYZ